MSDVQGLIEGNSKKYGDIRDQILKAMMPSQVEMDLEKRLNDIEALSRNINLSAQAGINKIKDQPVAMQFIVGQAKSVMEDANLQLQTMAAEQASVVDRLGLAQKARQTSLQVLETLYQFDKEDQALADAKSKLQKAEQESAKEFAMQYGITAPFYLIGKTVYNSATGKPYEDEKSFFAAGGANDFSNVQKVEVQTEDKILSATEAARLGLPYGTTQQQAAQLGITPSFGKTSSSNKSGPTRTTTNTGNPLTTNLRFTSSTAINSSIPSVISRAGGLTDANRYDLWDAVAQAIEAQGKNPTDYDSILWKYFHPEGSSGYKKYVLGQTSNSSDNNSDLP